MPENSHHSDQSDDLASLAYNLKVLQAFQQNGEEEWNEGKEVNEVHHSKEELDLSWTDNESDDVLKEEEDDHKVLNDVNE